MISTFIQNKFLKFAWFNRALSQTANIQFWQEYLCALFLIPLPDVLQCNIHFYSGSGGLYPTKLLDRCV